MIDILLVEDDKEICFILTELLKRNHYNVSAYWYAPRQEDNKK